MESNGKISESFLDTAACDALGINSPAESAAYEQELKLKQSGGEARRSDRDLRQTVSRLAAASPHMTPPADLRARILQATSPQSFRIQDYRRLDDNSRFYKWGFYAAALFLMAAAWFNLSTRNQLNRQAQQANQSVALLSQEIQQRNAALAMFVNPKSRQIDLVENDKVVAKFLVDDSSRSAVGFLAKGSLPQPTVGKLGLKEGANVVEYQALLLPDPGSYLQATPIQTVFQVQNLAPNVEQRTFKAQMPH